MRSSRSLWRGRPTDLRMSRSSYLGDATFRLKRVGEYMDAGKITVLGDIGMHCGNFMSGGTIEIHGNADGWLGREMAGRDDPLPG
jgi:formylmethanofuran dehydrogenase subunit C